MNVPLTGKVCAVVFPMNPHRDSTVNVRIFMILFIYNQCFPQIYKISRTDIGIIDIFVLSLILIK